MMFNNQPQYTGFQQQRIDNNNNIIWVDGEIGAKGYPLYGINNQVILLDRCGDNYTCYIKEQYQLNKIANGYDIVSIVDEQKILHKKYKCLIKED